MFGLGLSTGLDPKLKRHARTARVLFSWILGTFLCLSLGSLYAQDLADEGAFVKPGSVETLNDEETSDEYDNWDAEGEWDEEDIWHEDGGGGLQQEDAEYQEDDTPEERSAASVVQPKPKHREVLGSSEIPLGYGDKPARSLEIKVSWLYRKGIPVDPGPLPESFGSIELGDNRGLVFTQNQRVRIQMGDGDTSRFSDPWIIARKGKAFNSGASGRLLGYLFRGVGIIDKLEPVGSHYEGIISQSFEGIFAGDAIVPLSYWESIAEQIRQGSSAPENGTIHGRVLSIVFERHVGGMGDAIILDRGLGSNLKPGVRLNLEFELTNPTKKYIPPSGVVKPTLYGKSGVVEILWVGGALSLGRVLKAQKPVRPGDRISINLSSQDVEEDGARR